MNSVERVRIWRQTKKGKKSRYLDRKKYYNQVPGDPVVTGKSWNPEDDFLILNRSVQDRQLAMMLGRTIVAIQIRRYRLKNYIKQGGKKNGKER